MSYFPGGNSSPLHEIMPREVVRRMKDGLRLFDRKIRGYAGVEALLLHTPTDTVACRVLVLDLKCLQSTMSRLAYFSQED